MRVFRERNGIGGWTTRVSGTSPVKRPAKVLTGRELREKARKRAGKLVGFAIQRNRRKPRHNGYGLPRNRVIGFSIDAEVERAIIAEAKRRKMPKSALVGRLIEFIVDDELFAAILGDELGVKHGENYPRKQPSAHPATLPRRQGAGESSSARQAGFSPLSRVSTGMEP